MYDYQELYDSQHGKKLKARNLSISEAAKKNTVSAADAEQIIDSEEPEFVKRTANQKSFMTEGEKLENDPMK